MRKINTLPDLLAARIAAGEVIERPESVLRELLDNAIDSGADDIQVEIDGGGIERISVIDNGSGISREDLEVIAQRHATSKIRTSDDLYDIHTMGFRGEALYSIASVSRLTIASHDRADDTEHTITIDNGARSEVVPTGPAVGTRVTMEELFKEVPARRSFLKRNQTEAQACRNTLVAKALAFPNIGFKLYVDGAVKLSFEKATDLKDRVMMLYRPMGIADADTLYLKANGEDFSISAICTKSLVKRSDRRELRIYVNNRPVNEYSLQQAVTYGYGEMLPGGSFPYAAVFIDINPELADFNIHPAKREVKIRNIKEVHHALSLLLRNGLERVIPEIKAEDEEQTESLFSSDELPVHAKPSYDPRPAAWTGSFSSGFTPISEAHVHTEPKVVSDEKYEREESRPHLSTPRQEYSYREERKPEDNAWLEKAKALKAMRDRREAERTESREPDYMAEPTFRYIGQAFKLFLIAEKDGELYLVDQHAAHERILYDELLAKKSLQTLLVPIHISVEKDVDEFLIPRTDIYTRLGIMLQRVDECEWEIVALPALARPVEKDIIDFISSETGDEHELETKIFAIIACKAAIKAGDDIDAYSAESILEKVFEMPEPACPHGRTFLIRLTEKELRLMVGRTQ